MVEEILVVSIGKHVLRIDTTKAGRGEVFSAEEPLQCPLDKQICNSLYFCALLHASAARGEKLVIDLISASDLGREAKKEETIRDVVEDSITWPVRKVIPIIPGDYRYTSY